MVVTDTDGNSGAMLNRANPSGKHVSEGRKKVVPALCNVFGVLLLLVAIALSLPFVLPGYHVYEVTGNSMGSALPKGSIAFVQKADPSEVKVGEIIAFRDGDDIVMHRVTANYASLDELVTKGDENEMNDIDPVPYDALIGRVERHIDGVGAFATIYSGVTGVLYLLLLAACGVMLNMLARRMRSARGLLAPGEAGAGGEPAQQGRFDLLRRAVIVVLLIVFLGSAGVICYVMWQHHLGDEVYTEAIDRYTDGPTKTVDFDALRAVNPDIVGWIYCEGTVIDYPVVQGKDNDEYLYHDYKGDYNINGSIFVDADNSRGFVDSNTIIYGHHMNSGSMFAALEDWEDQAFYEEHPVMWLLTPEQNYRVVLFSGHHVNANSEVYEIIHSPGPQLDSLLSFAQERSDFRVDEQYARQLDTAPDESGIQLDRQGRYVMLSTCAYVFDNARYALHGELVPVASATN